MIPCLILIIYQCCPLESLLRHQDCTLDPIRIILLPTLERGMDFNIHHMFHHRKVIHNIGLVWVTFIKTFPCEFGKGIPIVIKSHPTHWALVKSISWFLSPILPVPPLINSSHISIELTPTERGMLFSSTPMC